MAAHLPSLRQAMSRFSRMTLRAGNSSLSQRCINVASRGSSQTTPISRKMASASHNRNLSSSTRRLAEQSKKIKIGDRTGKFTMRSAAVFVATGVGLMLYFQYEKARMERKRIVEMSKGYGKPKVGGPFTLRDLEGNEFTEKDILGKYTLIYFGFSHCPDICPDELDKMAEAIDIVQKEHPNTLRSVFITCDPARDTPAVLRSYLAEFHPSLVGLTGTWEQVKHVCKQYRVYFSTPPDLKPGEEDYLVDHSIYFYVMDPEGDFVECIGRQDTPESAAAIVLEHIKDWKRERKPLDTSPLPYLNVAPPAAAAAADLSRAPAPA